MPEGSIGGKYKTIEDADKGIAELEATLARITSERDKAANEITALKTPKPPAYGDEKGFEQHFNAKINLQEIATKAMQKKEFDPKDMAAIGELLKDGDPAFIGRVFTELRVNTELTNIEKAQKAATAKLGGEQQVKDMLEWHKKVAKPEEVEAFSKQWHTAATATDAATKLYGEFALANAKTPRSPGETGITANGTPPGGFKDRNEWNAAKEASKAKFGSDHFKTDPEYSRRYASTPDDVRRTFN